MVSDTTPHNFQSGGTPGGASTAEDKADLETQIDHLRKDLAGVTDALKSLASNQADDARRNVFALRDDVRGLAAVGVGGAPGAEECAARVRGAPPLDDLGNAEHTIIVEEGQDDGRAVS